MIRAKERLSIDNLFAVPFFLTLKFGEDGMEEIEDFDLKGI